MNDGPSGLAIGGGICLLPYEGLVPADIICREGRIADIRRCRSVSRPDIDATGCLVLPGIVDIHGDAFERQIMPRPGAMFPPAMALADTDHQLVTNGITTAYHGITLSWEPGLRSLAQSLLVISALDELAPRLAADHRLHIRWETFALDAVGAVQALLERRQKPVLAFNDHTGPLLRVRDVGHALVRHAERAMVAPDHYLALHEAAAARAGEVPGAIRTLAAAARAQGVAMLSHDDRSAGERSFYRGLGVRIAEFPVTTEALAASVAGGDSVVLGAPNVVRGGSHNGAVSAEAAVRAGECSILASDYYYPAPLHAALELAARGVLGLDRAWSLVSGAPAAAAGLEDRGRLAEGLRADLVVVREAARRVTATVCAGRAAYRAC